jgi:hypothetical protein
MFTTIYRIAYEGLPVAKLFDYDRIWAVQICTRTLTVLQTRPFMSDNLIKLFYKNFLLFISFFFLFVSFFFFYNYLFIFIRLRFFLSF